MNFPDQGFEMHCSHSNGQRIPKIDQTGSQTSPRWELLVLPMTSLLRLKGNKDEFYTD